jgi:L-threonylcarbamoyladenylate synthase
VPVLEEVCGRVDVGATATGVSRAPGQMAKHYSPRTPVELFDGNDLVDNLYEARQAGIRVGVVTFSWPNLPGEAFINLSEDPERASTLLYDALHRLDQAGYDRILVEMPPDAPEWTAVRDRLTRAASKS